MAITKDRYIGKPLDRVDGRKKVTGEARYAAEWPIEDLVYAVLVVSSIGKGRVKSIDTSRAKRIPGVLEILTHENAGTLHSQEQKERPGVDPEFGEPLSPLQDDTIRFNGQPIAVVLADTFEHATQAASLVKVSYQEDRPAMDFSHATKRALPPHEKDGSKRGRKRSKDYHRGDPDKALEEAEVKIEQTYTMPDEYHNAMELHVTIAVWEGGKLTLYDKTQWVYNVREQIALAFKIATEDIRVISPFVGGAFGSALRVWPHVLIAALAAKHIEKPVKLVLTRAQQYTVVGYRPRNSQTIALGAKRDGTLTAISHTGTSQTSKYEEYTESLVDPTRFLYTCPNVVTRYRLATLDVNTPASMRGPGEASGVYALESAMDELAVALNIDPLQLRLQNHSDSDPESDLPWSSKSLKECYHAAAERFGWNRRNPKPGTVRDGNFLIGHGMATATWPTFRMPATAEVRVLADGSALVRTAASDIGPGTYTVMTQIAADALGLAVERVQFELGDTKFPKAPVEGGSMTVASVGSAVHEAGQEARQKLIEAASRDDKSPLNGIKADEITIDNGRIFHNTEPSRGETIVELMKRGGHDSIEATSSTKPGDEQKKFSMHAFGTHFAEVHVDADLMIVRVKRVVSALAAGKIINPKTARSQAIGGIVGGIGMALLEEAVRDERNGRVMTANLADYHVPVHADIAHLDPFYVDEQDEHVNPLGAKGLAELSIVGVAAAIANAVYNATGKRIRDLPITPEKLLAAH